MRIVIVVAGAVAMATWAAGRQARGEAGATIAQTQPASRPNQNMVLKLGQGVTMTLVRIPSGRFLMGSPKTEKDRSNGEVQHGVTISQPFWMGIHEVTQEQWQAVMGNNPSGFKDAGHPVQNVSWNDADAFCRKASALTGRIVRLPTEAQWEYACRAGTTTPFNTGLTLGPDQANAGPPYVEGQDKSKESRNTTPVGNFAPNAWGLYDMHGNVWEWCRDWSGPLDEKETRDPQGPDSGRRRVIRGGSWDFEPGDARSAYRYEWAPDFGLDVFGFRVVVLDSLPAPRPPASQPATRPVAQELTALAKDLAGRSIEQCLPLEAQVKKTVGGRVETLVGLYRDSDRVAKRGIVRAVGLLGPAAGDAGLRLGLNILGDFNSSDGLDEEAAWAVTRMGPDAIVRIARLLEQKEHAYQFVAGLALLKLGPAAEPAVPIMIKTLTAPVEPDIRFGVVVGLQAVGRGAGAAVPALFDAYARGMESKQRKEGKIARGARQALRRIARGNVPAVVAAMESGNPAVRELATELLERARPDFQAEIGPLAHALASGDAGGKEAARRRLMVIAQAGKGLLQECIEDLHDSDSPVRNEAARALAKARPITDEAVNALAGALRQDESESVRLEAAVGLHGMGSAAAKVVPALREALHDKDESVRAMVAQILAEIEAAKPPNRPAP